MNCHDLWLRLRALTLRNRVERELEDELDFHIEMQTRKNLAAGISDAEARRRARIEFGGVARVEEECRDARRVNLIETLWQDIHYAIRGFRRSPTFVITVVATIALGLGLNTTLFSVFNAYILRPAPVRDPHALFDFFWANHATQGHSVRWPEYEEFRAHNPAFSETFAYRYMQVRVDGRNTFGQLVTGNYFRMLGVNAVLGRTLLPEDSSAPGREPVVVLSYMAWENRFASDPEIVGKKLIIRGYPVQVIGVAPAGFTGLGELMLDFWAPVTLSAQFQERSEFGVVGRLNRGLSVRQAKAGLALWAQRFTSGYPDVEKATTIHFQSRATSIPLSPNIVLISSPILVAFALVLLIACANVANMMLARAMSRQREIGIRLSLGAARSRLIRQLLTESVLLALPAAALGFVVSQTTIELATRAMFATIPAEFADFIRVAPMSPDIRVFGFMLAAAVVSAPLFGLAPALQATRSNVMQASRGDFTNEFRPTRLRNSLVVGQITVCLVLLISAGVLLRSAQRMQTLDIGLRTRDVIEIEFQKKFRSRVLAQISSESFVRMFAAAKDPPLDGAFPKVPVRTTDGEDFTQASSNHVSPEYFTVLEIPILRGRNFTKEEANSAAPVVIVSQATAQRLWPGREALGQSLHIRHDQLASVIGISRDVVSGFVGNGVDGTCIYFPTSPRASGNALLVAVTGDPEIARRKLDADLTAIDSGVVEQIHKLQEFVAGQLYPFQVAYWVCSAIGALALLLTLSGIYGVLSYAVSQRTKEIGIRMAMGATTPSVIGLVLNQSMKLAVTGVVLGAILAAGVSRIFASLLAMMNTFDGLAYGASMLLVLAACAAAAYFPSRKAVRIDPVSTLRCD